MSIDTQTQFVIEGYTISARSREAAVLAVRRLKARGVKPSWDKLAHDAKLARTQYHAK